MTTSLTLYPTNTASSTLANAAKLVTGTGAGSQLFKSAIAAGKTGYGEACSLGTTGAWAGAGSIGSPTGKGWLFDVTTLEGQEIIAGNWTPAHSFSLDNATGTITADIYCRLYKYNSGTYTLISTLSLTAQTLNTTQTKYTFAASSLSGVFFATGDKLYYDFWFNVTANTTTIASNIQAFTSNSSTQGNLVSSIATPGYTPYVAVSATLTGAGTLSGTGSYKASLSKTITGAGTISGTGSYKTSLSKTVHGVGTLSGTGSYKTSLSKTIHGVGTLTGTLQVVTLFAGVGVLNATASYKTSLSVTMSGHGSVTATGSLKTALSRTIAGTGTISGTGSYKTALSKTINGTGTLTATLIRGVFLAKTITGSGTLTGTVTRKIFVTATLSGVSTLSGNLAVIHAYLTTTFHGSGIFLPSPIARDSYYLTPTATSTLSSAAGIITTPGGGIQFQTTAIAVGKTGFGELTAIGTSSAWAGAGTLGAPTGKGWLFDTTSLEGQTTFPQVWIAQPSFCVDNATGTISGTLYFRASKYNSGTYTQIGVTALTGVTLNTTRVQFTFSGNAFPPVSFATGEKLYVDCWINVTSNTMTIPSNFQVYTSSSGTLGNIASRLLIPRHAVQAFLAATLSGNGVFSSTLSCKVTFSTTFTGHGALSGTVKISFVTFAGTGTLTGTASAETLLSCTLTGASNVIAAVRRSYPAAVTMQGTGALSATPNSYTLNVFGGNGTLRGTLSAKTTLLAAFAGHGFLFGLLKPPLALSVTFTGAGTIAIVPTVYEQRVLAANPVAYYRMNEGVGSIAKDSSGNGHDAQLITPFALSQPGALPYEPDTAIYFGIGGTIMPPLTLTYWTWQAISVEFWVSVGDGWHYVVATSDNQNIYLYIDGSQTTSNPNGPLEIDALFGLLGNYGAGTLDEIAIYNYKLTDFQIQDHWQAATGTPVPPPPPPPPTVIPPGYTLSFLTGTIGGQPVMIVAGSVTIQNAIGRRSTAQFTVLTDTQTFFEYGQPVALYNLETLVFSGYISQDSMSQPGFQPVLLHVIQTVDQHYLADKRIIAASYSNSTPGLIARTLINDYLASEGVTIGEIVDSGVYPSPTLYPSKKLYPTGAIEQIPAITFGYCTGAQAFDALASRADSSGTPFYWEIDMNKQFWFVPYTANVNATVIDGTQIDMKVSVPTLLIQSPLYRNQQYLLGGTGQTVQQTETRKGDGNTTAWTMGFALASVPTVKVNNAVQTVGIKGNDTGFAYYWAKGDPTITQDTSLPKLVSTDTLTVIYIGQYNTVIVSGDSTLIAAQQQVEGGNTSGLVEVAANDTTIQTTGEGYNYVAKLLKKYGVPSNQFTFSTLQQGIQQGHLLTVNVPSYNLNNVQMLAESVTASDSSDSFNLWYTVSAITGPYDQTWVDFFGRLLRNAEQAPLAVGIAQVLSLVVATTLSFTTTLTVTVIEYQPPFPNTTLYPSPTLYP